ncbi:hypothetical protein ABZ754_15640 [Micromonospora purpureochromogenes]|uniref:hypothetical protein n=1 Tax=Micromonospora purpureochromogenes TaxID=47872 RepID=UPI0033C0E6EF
MEIHLVPETGVRLPPVCQLAFGAAEHDVVSALTSIGDVQEAFVCRFRAEAPLSAKMLALGDVTMTFGFSGMPGALHTVGVGRSADDQTGAVAVVFDDVDLFGWPADEVVAALRDVGHEVHHPGSGNVWIDGQLWLYYQPRGGTTPAGRKPRWEPPRYLNYVCLYSPHPD